jgi:drug/metabolite transporter (DMT)-like permease
VQIGRGLLMLIGNALFVVAIVHVPLATASAIGFTAPLIVTALAGPLLREHVGLRRWSAVLIGFAGALVIIRPGGGLPGGAFDNPMLLLLLLGSATHALYLIATRWIGHYDDPATSIVYSALMGSLITSLVLPFAFVWPRDAFDLAMLGSLGLIGAAGHYLVIRAFRHGPAAVIAPLGYVELVGTATLGYLIFGNFPDTWTWIGAAIIVASGIYIAIRERRRRLGSIRQSGSIRN